MLRLYLAKEVAPVLHQEFLAGKPSDAPVAYRRNQPGWLMRGHQHSYEGWVQPGAIMEGCLILQGSTAVANLLLPIASLLRMA